MDKICKIFNSKIEWTAAWKPYVSAQEGSEPLEQIRDRDGAESDRTTSGGI